MHSLTHAFSVLVPIGSPTDIAISYLPNAHIYEAGVEIVMMSAGAQVAFYQGDLRKIAVDISDIKPTVFPGVPKVFQV